MGGRGGGRGMSFTLEQMGLSRGESIPAPVLTPPPHYPLLEHYPAVMSPAPRHHAMLSYRANMLSHLSRYAEGLRLPGPDRSRSLEQETPVQRIQLDFHWASFPAELRPGTNRKRKSVSQPKSTKDKQPKPKNFEALLEELEKKEEVVVKKEVNEEEAHQNEDEEEMEDEEDEDEEMDEGTDYNQNYFDNGEGFLEDDDDADDSPVY